MMCPVTLGTSEVPAARRASAPGWRDPRLWVGVAVVAGSVFAGSVVVGSSDETVGVWAAAGPLATGHVLTSGDLAVRRVRFADPADADRYLPADRALPSGLRLSRAVGAGELVPQGAVAPDSRSDLRQLPVAVPPDQVPQAVGVGDVVDVYVRPAAREGCAGSTVCDGSPALSEVTVLEAPAVADEFGSDGSRMLVLATTGAQARHFFALLASTDGASLTVVGRG
jgi:hypothetical protein